MKRLLVLVAACGSPSAPPPPQPSPPQPSQPQSSPVVADAAPGDPRRWFAGDVHMHVAPPDDPTDVTMNVHAIAAAARTNGLDFVVLTPHLWGSRWGDAFRAEWRTLARDAAAIAKPAMIPGVEWGDGDGHVTV